MIVLAHLLLALLATPALLSCSYLLLLTTLASQGPVLRPSRRSLTFDVIVPAHDEAANIAQTVGSLRCLEWPGACFQIWVIADNCSDDTAERAREAGAQVLERFDTEQRGKGYALAFAFEKSRERGFAEAVVVVDADSEASANLLEAIAARIEAGADAVQTHYGVLNPMASWRTRLVTIAMSAFHLVRSRARERLGVSCGIRGNGWCVTHRALRQVPYQAYSLTEDLEFGIDLGLAGIRVAYADEARVVAEMVSGEANARRQRERWEGGRFALIRTRVRPLLAAAWNQRSRVCLDLALDLLVLPLSYVALNVLLLLLLALAAASLAPGFLPWVIGAAGALAVLIFYVGRGWRLSGVGWIGLFDLARAPLFVVWKLWVMLRRKPSAEWVRTGRERL